VETEDTMTTTPRPWKVDNARHLPMLDNYHSRNEQLERAIQRERSRKFFLYIWQQGQEHNKAVRKTGVK
jgi:hypothetical protein